MIVNLAALFLVSNLSPAQPIRLRLAPQGDLLGWLVSQPYPNPDTKTAFNTDYLNGEPQADPVEDATWRFAQANVAQGLDLKALHHTDASGVAYCYTRLESAKPCDAQLHFGSDDGAKVYLNGNLVFSRDIKRGVKRDEETVPIHFQKGQNRLLFKIEQYDGGWGLMARLTFDKSENILQRLDIAPAPQNPIRSLAGKPGSYDLAAYQQYTQETAKAQLFLERLKSKAKSPDDLQTALQHAADKLKTSQQTADTASDALIQANKEIAAAYKEARSLLLAWAQNPGPIDNANPEQEDYIRVMPGGRYFMHANGAPFIPIGINHNPDWPQLEESNPLARHYSPEQTDRWFAKLQANGVNVVRLMVETPPSGNLEEKVGVIRPEHLIWLDNIFEAARKHDVKLWITPYDTFWMSLRADASPYWSFNGGPIDKPIDFLTKPEIVAAQKNRIKFLIDRYGNSGAIFAWEIMNEVDLWWTASPEQIKSWTDDMAQYVRNYERAKWGKNHMLTISFADSKPKGLNAETAFRRPDLDFATMHLYIGVTKAPKPGDAEQAGIDFATGVTYARQQEKDNRPVLDGESGPIDHWVDDVTLDDAVYHQMSWQHLLAGGAGPGTRWPYRHPHNVTDGMLKTLKSMRAFCDGVPWPSLTGPQITIPHTDKAVVFATEHGAIAWFSLPQNAKDRTLDLKPNAQAKGQLFDVATGKWLAPPQNGGHFTIPEGVTEVAVWLTW